MNKELEEAIEILNKIKRTYDIQAPNVNIRNRAREKVQAIETVLNYIENSIPKKKVEEKLIIDSDKLNHSTNGILSEMYKARITLAKELLEVE